MRCFRGFLALHIQECSLKSAVKGTLENCKKFVGVCYWAYFSKSFIQSFLNLTAQLNDRGRDLMLKSNLKNLYLFFFNVQILFYNQPWEVLLRILGLERVLRNTLKSMFMFLCVSCLIHSVIC